MGLRNDIRIWLECPCCHYPTFVGRGDFDICYICDYEDDGLDDDRPDQISGPNGDYTLNEMRKNFELHMTGYRPSDQEAFARDRRYIDLKKKVTEFLKEQRFKKQVELSVEQIDAINEMLQGRL